MAQKKLSAEALALIYLREARRWTQKELATAKGLTSPRLISRYETGAETLSRAELDGMAALMGFSREEVEALLLTSSLITPPGPEESGSLVELTREELRGIDRTVLADGWTRSAGLRARLIADKKRRKAETARHEAGELWARLKPLSRAVRREVVEDAPDFQTWALAVRLCEESKRAAAQDPREALHLADLALFTASRVAKSAGEARCSRLLGYAWAYKGNAFRVAGDLVKAGEAFVRGWQLWKEGAADEPYLPEWRMLSLEASLRREERRFPAALELLARAEICTGGEPEAVASILLQKEFVQEQMGDFEGALATLAKAAPFVEASHDLRLLFGQRFETAKALCSLKRYEDAELLLDEARALAERLGNKMDFVRVHWLTARVNAGLGRRKEAVAGLEQVRRELTAREIPYDAALSSLELAILYLEEDRTSEVKALAREMAPIFQAQGIAREALAALSVFSEAAQREAASLELVKRVMADIAAARRVAPRTVKGGRG
jgi:transcriptional regulator with XRE-family HTH domain